MRRTQPVLRDNVTQEDLNSYCTYLLSAQDYTEGRLREKLKERYPHQSEWHDSAIELMTQRGYLDDARFAERFVRSCREQKLGPNKIREKMNNKRFSREMITQSLEALSDEEGAKESLLQDAIDWRMKWHGADDIKDYKLRTRYMGRLVRKGFPFDVAKRALDRIEEE